MKLFFSDAHQVHCSEDWMKVDIVLPSIPGSLVYLEGMKGYPNPKCQPESTAVLAQFKLSLKDFYDCGVTRVVNKITVSESVHFFQKRENLKRSRTCRGRKCSSIK